MKRSAALWISFLLVIAHAALAHGATRYIQSSGTSSGSGKASITIESASAQPPNSSLSRSQQIASLIEVTIPSGSSPVNSTILIRDTLDAALSVDYVVDIYLADVVRIQRPSGSFSMTVSENVPGQTIAEYSPTVFVPFFGSAGPLVGVFALLLTGAAFLWWRRRGTESRPLDTA